MEDRFDRMIDGDGESSNDSGVGTDGWAGMKPILNSDIGLM